MSFCAFFALRMCYTPSSGDKFILCRKDPDTGKDWRQEKGMTEDEMVGWCHWLNGHEFEQALGDGEGQGSLSDWMTTTTALPSASEAQCFLELCRKNGFCLIYYPCLSLLSLIWGCVIFHHLGIRLYCFLCYCGVILLNSTVIFLSSWHSKKERRKRNLFLTLYFLLQSSQFRGAIFSRPMLMQWADFTPHICAPYHTVVQSLPRFWWPVCILHWRTLFGLFQGLLPPPKKKYIYI